MSTSSSGNSNKDNVFDLDSTAFGSDQFRMHEFKVKRCPRARPHDWTQCPFAHPGEKARRRDPRRYRYSGTACPEFRKSGCCRRGDACPFAHGVFECWLHPSRYRTQLCTDGQSCKRRVCFFAHCETELRRPEDDPVTAERQVQAELAAEVQVLQQQHLAQALQTILDAGGMSNGNTGTQTAASSPLFALELLKQVTMPATAPMMGAGDSAEPNNGSNNALSLLQQLGMLQPQQQQAQGASQQPQGPTQQGGKIDTSSTSKPLQGLLSGTNQEDLQQALKQVLEQQLTKTASDASIVTSAPCDGSPTSQPDNVVNTSTPFMSGPGGMPIDTSQLLQLDPALLQGLLGQNSVARPRMAATNNRHSIDNSFLASKLLGMSTTVPTEGSGQGTMLPMQVSQGLVDAGHARRSLDSFVDPMAMGQGDHYVNGGLPQMNGGAVAGVPLDQNPALSAQLLQLDPALLNSLAARARHAGVGASSQRMMDNGFLARMSNVDVSGIVNGVVAQPEAAPPSQMVVPGVPVQTPDVNAGFVQNGALMAQAQALLQCLHMEGVAQQHQQSAQQQQPPPQQQHYGMMGTYDKGMHERVSAGNEASALMPSNMLQ